MLANGVTDPENPVRPTNGLAAYPLGSAVKMARCAPERKVKLLPPPHRPPVLRLLATVAAAGGCWYGDKAGTVLLRWGDREWGRGGDGLLAFFDAA